MSDIEIQALINRTGGLHHADVQADRGTEINGTMDKYVFAVFIHFSLSFQATRQIGGGLDAQESPEILQGLYSENEIQNR